MRLPFGRLHGRNPEIIHLAARIGRTPGALAMKACNFASLDPAFRRTNRTGLTGASESDRALWAEFSADAERVAAEAEDVFAQLDPARAARDEAEVQVPEGETDVLRLVRARRVQGFFRAAVLTSYDCRCAISGLALPRAARRQRSRNSRLPGDPHHPLVRLRRTPRRPHQRPMPQRPLRPRLRPRADHDRRRPARRRVPARRRRGRRRGPFLLPPGRPRPAAAPARPLRPRRRRTAAPPPARVPAVTAKVCPEQPLYRIRALGQTLA